MGHLLTLFGGGSSNVPAFSPSDIAGLALWLDANDTATLWQDSSATVAVTANSDPVRRWDDKSGSGRHATAQSDAERPTWRTGIQNGKPGLLFDGVNDRLLGSSPFSTAINQVTMLAAVKISTSSEAGYIFNNGTRAAASADTGYGFGVGSTTLDGAGGNLVGVVNAVSWMPTGSAIGSGSHVISYTINGSNLHSFYRNGTNVYSATQLPSFTPAVGYDVGSGGNIRFFDSYVLEIVCYSALLSDTNRGLVEAYLKAKWGTP